ncbi:MAG: tetratricopeptide repeat protein [Terriglobales bacterium]|jgi:tetratricopeptide (TPR) repeat protein
MLALSRNNLLIATFACCIGVASASARQTHTTVRHHPAQVQEASAASGLLDQAEALLAKGDYSGAQSMLQQATAKDPQSYQAWYDLGYADRALHQDIQAITAYRNSLEINPKIFETNLNLGLTLAASGQNDDSIKYLTAATELQPASHPEQAKEHAWLALGSLLLGKDPPAAEHAFAEAARLVPEDPEPHLLLGTFYESSNKLDRARAQYQQVLAGSHGEARAQALRGLVNVAVGSKQYSEAESKVRDYLAAAPADSQAHLLLGRLLAAQGKNDEALSELSRARVESDPAILREKAELLSAVHRESDALPIYKALVERSGNDARLRYEYGLSLMHQQQWTASEEQLLAAVKLNPNLADAYGDLAVASSENKQYDLTLKALDVRTKLLPDNPGTFFLRATALDHLRRYPEATQNYRQFLAAANGKYPDEEWKARHRLIAIQNLK